MYSAQCQRENPLNLSNIPDVSYHFIDFWLFDDKVFRLVAGEFGSIAQKVDEVRLIRHLIDQLVADLLPQYFDQAVIKPRLVRLVDETVRDHSDTLVLPQG